MAEKRQPLISEAKRLRAMSLTPEDENPFGGCVCGDRSGEKAIAGNTIRKSSYVPNLKEGRCAIKDTV